MEWFYTFQLFIITKKHPVCKQSTQKERVGPPVEGAVSLYKHVYIYKSEAAGFPKKSLAFIPQIM